MLEYITSFGFVGLTNIYKQSGTEDARQGPVPHATRSVRCDSFVSSCELPLESG